MSISVTILGLFFSFLFHLGVRERGRDDIRRSYIANPNDSTLANSSDSKSMGILDWFKIIGFYTTAIAYMCARLVANLLMVFGPVYTTNTLVTLPKQWVGYVPLIMYFSGFVMTFVVKYISKYGVKWPYLIGAIASIGGSIGVLFLDGEDGSVEIYAVVIVFIIFGIGSNALVCSSMELITELIGPNTKTGGFVFGFMSLTDKVANGLVVVLVETFAPCGSYSNGEVEDEADTCPLAEEGEKSIYYKNLMSYGIAGMAVFGLEGEDRDNFFSSHLQKFLFKKS